MTILKSSQISDMSEPEIEEHITELRSDLMKIRGVLASGGIPEDVGKAREIRKTIARLLTIQQQKQSKTKEETKKK